MSSSQTWPWLPPLPADRPLVRLGFISRLQTGLTVHGGRDLDGDVVTRPYLRVANVQAGWVSLDDITEIVVPREMANRSTLREGDVLMTEGGDLDKLGRGTVWRDEIRGCLHQNHVFAIRPDPSKLNADYLAWVTQSLHGRCYFESTGSRTTNLASTNSSKIAGFPIPLPNLDLQERIADFLDREIGAMNGLSLLRSSSERLLRERLTLLVDGAVVGDPDALRELGIPYPADIHHRVKLSRVCEITPGFSFPSAEFSLNPSDTRLLRGVNVGVGTIDWSESVFWPADQAKKFERFSLRQGDLIMGMDRPWISEGLRLSIIQDADLPALLLQRVARLRPQRGLNADFLFWTLFASHLRKLVEAELTGVSVPHLSGEQIGSYRIWLPEMKVQRMIAESLREQAAALKDLRSTIDRQLMFLAERKQTLITAAVTGQIDATTARAV
ncbi:hypothetical protein ACIBEJ_51930 [Nonomuraea sp. NPDC050790]|uniref:hypothetical protein n=1 Tax=Nonomuraea sp. NPDC050790 TaxID=3364371 RepID=UPI00378D8647